MNPGNVSASLSSERVALSDYRHPTVPAHHIAVRIGTRARRLLGRDNAEPVMDDRLRQARADTLQGTFREPDYARFIDVLEQALQGWRNDGDEAPRVQVLVLPPCEREALMHRLADRHADLVCLEPPPRDALIGPAQLPIDEPGSDDDIIVVPCLQHWFLRHHRGLRHGRALLQRVSSGSRRWLIGVDAWSWRYLVRAASADLLLPTPSTCQATDASQLAHWLSALIDSTSERPISVKAAKGGAEVFARDDDGKLLHDFLRELAARSLGIPWVAWHLWRRGLRTLPDEEIGGREDDGAGNRKAEGMADAIPAASRDGVLNVWVTDDVDPVLPAGHDTDALLLLHSLLIHDGLRSRELCATLPATLPVDALLGALERSGFIGRDAPEGDWYVLPGAYPVVRTALAEGDWSMAEL